VDGFLLDEAEMSANYPIEVDVMSDLALREYDESYLLLHMFFPVDYVRSESLRQGLNERPLSLVVDPVRSFSISEDFRDD